MRIQFAKESVIQSKSGINLPQMKKMAEKENLVTMEWLLKCAASLAILGEKGWIKITCKFIYYHLPTLRARHTCLSTFTMINQTRGVVF